MTASPYRNEASTTPGVLVLRHCESVGWQPDAPLSQDGQRQAKRLAKTLAGFSIDHIACSPYRRARESIAPFAQSLGLAVQTDERLAERRRGEKNIDDYARFVHRSFMDFDFCQAGGESGREVGMRGLAVVTQMLDCAYRLPLLSTHGQLLSFLAALTDPGFDYDCWQTLSFPDLFRFSHNNGALTFERLAIA